jgi:hypothetical protein
MNGPEWVAISVPAAIALLLVVRLVASRRRKRDLKAGWWHARSETLRGYSFDDAKARENDSRKF